MKPKKVEMTELFYDLVFAYAISKMTSIIEHTQNGISIVPSLIVFITMYCISELRGRQCSDLQRKCGNNRKGNLL